MRRTKRLSKRFHKKIKHLKNIKKVEDGFMTGFLEKKKHLMIIVLGMQ